MALFTRSKDIGTTTDHRENVDLLRRDFSFRCAYCLSPEPTVNERFFHVDHYIPRVLFKNGTTEYEGNFYENLYWACPECNLLKGDSFSLSAWQVDEWFVDFCEYEVEEQYEIQRNFEFRGLTVSAKFTIEALQLNSHTQISRRRDLRLGLYGRFPEYEPKEVWPFRRMIRAIARKLLEKDLR